MSESDTVSNAGSDGSNTNMWDKGDDEYLPFPEAFEGQDPYQIYKSPACINRRVSTEWDDYDTIFYNKWQDIQLDPTKTLDQRSMETLGLWEPLSQLMSTLGMGRLATQPGHLYPDVVRQFIASAQLEYPTAGSPAHDGVLSYKIDGEQHTITVPELCDIYGFERRGARRFLPSTFADRDAFWAHIASGTYFPQSTKQTFVRHPALRILARVLSLTLQNKPEPGRMYQTELQLLYYACGAALEYTDSKKDYEYNMGAIWAQYLVSLKTRPFKGPQTAEHRPKKNAETFGSLLHPIFRFNGIVRSRHARTPFTSHLFNLTYLRNAKIVMPPTAYHCHISASQVRVVTLPRPDLCRVDTADALDFEPDVAVEDAHPPRTSTQPARRSSAETRPRRRRADPPRRSLTPPPTDTAADATEEQTWVPTAEWADFYPPPQPTVPASTAEFQEYTLRHHRRQYSIFRRIMSHLLGCARPPSPPSPTARAPRRSPPPIRTEMEVDDQPQSAAHFQSVDHQRRQSTDQPQSVDQQTEQSADQRSSRPTDAQTAIGSIQFHEPPPFTTMPPAYWTSQTPHPDYFIGTSSRGTAEDYDDYIRQRSRSPREYD